MRLSTDEVLAFEAACRSRHNQAVEELFNALGVTNASEVLLQVATAPSALSNHIAGHVRAAIAEHQTSAR